MDMRGMGETMADDPLKELRECPDPSLADVIARHVRAALVAHGLIEGDDEDDE